MTQITSRADDNTRVLARFAAELQFEDVPPGVVRAIRASILDTIGSGLYGSTTPWGRIIGDFACRQPGPSVVWGRRAATASSHYAAMANATMAHGFELDDLHPGSRSHPGAVMTPIALALHPAIGSISGRSMIAALAVGYEIQGRVGLAQTVSSFNRGWHPTGTAGAFGAAAAARLQGLGPEQTQHALGIAGAMPAGLMAAQFGAMVKRLYVGHATWAGMVGADLAASGFTGVKDILDAEYGGYLEAVSDETRPDLLVHELGERFEAGNIGVKFWPCVGTNQVVLDAMAAILAATKFDADDVERIEIQSDPLSTDRVENITSSIIFLATLIHAIRTIKLATGTSNLSQSHPTLIASHAAMFDHPAKGRFIFGISPGNLRTDAEAIGNLAEDRNKLFAEAIDVILEIWTREAPYRIDLPDDRFKVTTETTAALEIGLGYLARPYQKPHPEIVGTVVAPFSKGVVLMGRRDFHPISANFLLDKWAATHWGNYAEGKASVGKAADPSDWRIARTIFVADDDATAKAYGGGVASSPYHFHYNQIMTKFARIGRLAAFKEHKDQPDSEVTLDSVMDKLVIRGSVNSVVDQILAMREITGDFGEFVYAGMDWVDPKLARRSMELMATEVMPRVNAAIRDSSGSKSMQPVSA